MNRLAQKERQRLITDYKQELGHFPSSPPLDMKVLSKRRLLTHEEWQIEYIAEGPETMPEPLLSRAPAYSLSRRALIISHRTRPWSVSTNATVTAGSERSLLWANRSTDTSLFSVASSLLLPTTGSAGSVLYRACEMKVNRLQVDVLQRCSAMWDVGPMP